MGCAQMKKGFVIDDSIAETMERYLLSRKEIEKLWKLFARADAEYS